MINGKRSKLTMAMAEEKRHYKMYKRGKTWVIVGMSLFFTAAFGAVTMQTAKADTAVTDTAQVGTSSAATTTSDQPADATNSVAGSSAAPAACDDQSASSVATDVSSAQAKESSVANDTTAVPASASSAVAASGNESAQSASDGTQSVAPASFAVSSAEAEKWTPRVARVSYKMAVAASAAQVKSEDDAATSRTTNGTPVKEMTTTFESNGSNVKLKRGNYRLPFKLILGLLGSHLMRVTKLS
ncbi:KxYKxGKxW signal peptide domain-containing protein [Secundilactobacillus kimchicus]|uniref:KxYKxGKxW signal peptide domain-containing protein n=1 Tax=Secundilactobacillus kimchicus TaxID=528209 RepID=UPI0024A831E2|nr:KxYKxGKxW signal peptide domain-containing protein [Secundilactobacillus kimchicus]